MLTMVEGRVLGALMEKQRTVPDQYPLTLNGLVLACNQSTSRAPVMSLEPDEVDLVVNGLKPQGFTRLVHPVSGRGVTKYRHVVGEVLDLDPAGQAVLSLLLLRGPQTSAELRARSERQHEFTTLDEVDETLRDLAGREQPLVELLDRQPGQKEARWRQLLAEEPASVVGHGAAATGAVPSGGLGARVTALEADNAALATQVEELTGRVARLESALTELL